MGIKFKFQPLFLIYVFLCIYFNWFNQIFYYVFVATLHEYGHYIVAKHYGYDLGEIIFSLNGAGIANTNNFKPKEQIIIAIAGPFVNIILILFTLAMFWVCPTTYLYTYEFLMCNFAVLFFNLIPIYPLDGGRIIMSILIIKKHNKYKLLKINKCICLVFGAIFLILFIISLFFKINYNLLIISCFLTINYTSFDNYMYYENLNVLNKNKKSCVEVKTFRVDNVNKVELIKRLSPHYYSIFKVIDKDGKEKFEIDENDLIN